VVQEQLQDVERLFYYLHSPYFLIAGTQILQ
jgi:hypothetical protein